MLIMGMGFHLRWPYRLVYSIEENIECLKEDTASLLTFI